MLLFHNNSHHLYGKMNLKSSSASFLLLILIQDNGANKGICRSNVERRSRKRKNKKPSNKQNKQSMTFTKTTTIKRRKPLHKQGRPLSSSISEWQLGKKNPNILRLEMTVLEEPHGKELPSMWIFLKRVQRVVALLDIASFCFP
jgi:hypothetical protein